MAAFDCNLLFIILSVIVGIVTVIAGVLYIITLTFKSFVLGVYFCIFGLSTILLEIFFANALLSWFGFYARWVGKGFFFIFLGILILDTTIWYWLAIGVFNIVVGVLYIIINFIPAVGSPRPIRGHQGANTTPPNA